MPIVVEIPSFEHDKLTDQIKAGLTRHEAKLDTTFGSELAALTNEFVPTTNIRDARWLYADSYYACILIRVDPDGSMVHLKQGF